jgi:hypothetical protein
MLPSGNRRLLNTRDRPGAAVAAPPGNVRYGCRGRTYVDRRPIFPDYGEFFFLIFKTIPVPTRNAVSPATIVRSELIPAVVNP